MALPRSWSCPRFLSLASLLLITGCAEMATDIGIKSSVPSTIQAKEDRFPAVTTSGRAAAVVSFHTRKSFENACKYGITLTNNLPFKITDLSYRFTAIIQGSVPYDSQTKNFSQLRPSEQQYRELTFQGVRCDQIDRIEVADPGRCTLDDLNRFNAAPGDCSKFSDLATSRLVSVVWKKK